MHLPWICWEIWLWLDCWSIILLWLADFRVICWWSQNSGLGDLRQSRNRKTLRMNPLTVTLHPHWKMVLDFQLLAFITSIHLNSPPWNLRMYCSTNYILLGLVLATHYHQPDSPWSWQQYDQFTVIPKALQKAFQHSKFVMFLWLDFWWFLGGRWWKNYSSIEFYWGEIHEMMGKSMKLWRIHRDELDEQNWRFVTRGIAKSWRESWRLEHVWWGFGGVWTWVRLTMIGPIGKFTQLPAAQQWRYQTQGEKVPQLPWWIWHSHTINAWRINEIVNWWQLIV